MQSVYQFGGKHGELKKILPTIVNFAAWLRVTKTCWLSASSLFYFLTNTVSDGTRYKLWCWKGFQSCPQWEYRMCSIQPTQDFCVFWAWTKKWGSATHDTMITGFHGNTFTWKQNKKHPTCSNSSRLYGLCICVTTMHLVLKKKSTHRGGLQVGHESKENKKQLEHRKRKEGDFSGIVFSVAFTVHKQKESPSTW